MPVPDFQSLTKPVLEIASDGLEYRTPQFLTQLAIRFGLSAEDQAELLPSGRQTRFANRVHWAIAYLTKCKLLQRVSRGVVAITDRGRETLATNPERIDLAYLARFPELKEFRGSTQRTTADTEDLNADAAASSTPDERLRSAHAEIDAALRQELLDRVRAGSPLFFERTVLDLLLAMGFGSAGMRHEHLGRTGDDGIDGVIEQDALGLDRIYVQAKRWTSGNVGSREIRDFADALEMQKATKGVFITTSKFTPDAQATAERLSKRIVLIDGEALATLMVRRKVGVRTEQTFEIQRIDEDFFIEE